MSEQSVCGTVEKETLLQKNSKDMPLIALEIISNIQGWKVCCLSTTPPCSPSDGLNNSLDLLLF